MAQTIGQKHIAKAFARMFGSSSVKWGRAKQVLAKAGMTGMFDRGVRGVHAKSRSTFTQNEVKTIFEQARAANAELHGTGTPAGSFRGERGDLRGRSAKNIFQYLARKTRAVVAPPSNTVRPAPAKTVTGRSDVEPIQRTATFRPDRTQPSSRQSQQVLPRQAAAPVSSPNAWRADGDVSTKPTIRPIGSAGIGVTRYTQEAREKPSAGNEQSPPSSTQETTLPDTSHVDDGIPL